MASSIGQRQHQARKNTQWHPSSPYIPSTESGGMPRQRVRFTAPDFATMVDRIYCALYFSHAQA